MRYCIACGNGVIEAKAYSGRVAHYKGLTVELPAELSINECSNCKGWLIDAFKASEIDAYCEQYLASIGDDQATFEAMDLAQREARLALDERISEEHYARRLVRE